MKRAREIQSPAEHFGNTGPLMKLTVIKNAKLEKFIAYFAQIP